MTLMDEHRGERPIRLEAESGIKRPPGSGGGLPNFSPVSLLPRAWQAGILEIALGGVCCPQVEVLPFPHLHASADPVTLPLFLPLRVVLIRAQ